MEVAQGWVGDGEAGNGSGEQQAAEGQRKHLIAQIVQMMVLQLHQMKKHTLKCCAEAVWRCMELFICALEKKWL